MKRKQFSSTQKFALVVSVVILLVAAYFTAQHLIGRPHTPKKTHETYKNIPSKKAAIKPKPKVVSTPKDSTSIPNVKAHMAIVLDDWGNRYGVFEELLELNIPITLAILPHLPHSKKIAAEAHAKGLGVILHMPMQPFSAGEDLEPHTILTTSTDAEIEKYLSEAIASVPYLEGVNNHMGSKATSDPRVMKKVISVIKDKKLFFLDSFVTPKSVALNPAREYGIPFARRDIFIDNVVTHEAVTAQLLEARDLALRNGEVIVIGHDKAVTIAAIKKIIPVLKSSGVELVLLRELVSRDYSRY